MSVHARGARETRSCAHAPESKSNRPGARIARFLLYRLGGKLCLLETPGLSTAAEASKGHRHCRMAGQGASRRRAVAVASGVALLLGGVAVATLAAAAATGAARPTHVPAALVQARMGAPEVTYSGTRAIMRVPDGRELHRMVDSEGRAVFVTGAGRGRASGAQGRRLGTGRPRSRQMATMKARVARAREGRLAASGKPRLQALEAETGAYHLNVAAFIFLSLGGALLVAIRVGIPSALAK